MDEFGKQWQAIEQAEVARQKEYLRRARRDVRVMLEGQPPPEGEEYGFWSTYMARLRQPFEQAQASGVTRQLMTMLREPGSRVKWLLQEADISDEEYRLEVSEQVWRHMQAEERKAAAERQMAERLARTTGDSLADEILAMLRERDLSRTDIYRHYSRNVSAAQINDALFVLEHLGWARWKMVSTGGRRREVWYLPSDEA